MGVTGRLAAEATKKVGGHQLDTVEHETEFICPITGKRIHRKTVDCGLLANAGADTTAHGIVTMDVAEGAHFRIRGCISDGTTQEDIHSADGVSKVEVNVTNIVITSTADLSSHRCVVELEYVKT